jgi:hypothetical protein
LKLYEILGEKEIINLVTGLRGGDTKKILEGIAFAFIIVILSSNSWSPSPAKIVIMPRHRQTRYGNIRPSQSTPYSSGSSQMEKILGAATQNVGSYSPEEGEASYDYSTIMRKLHQQINRRNIKIEVAGQCYEWKNYGLSNALELSDTAA